MIQFYLKYLSLSVAVGFGFLQFIACGAQMYQVSLEEDISPSPAVVEAGRLGSAGGASLTPGIHSENGWLDLPVAFQLGSKLTEEQKKGLLAAMKTWELAVGRTLFSYEGTHQATGDNFPDLYSSLTDLVNGHYLDLDWAKTKKSRFVLATTIWDNDPSDLQTIIKADIRYNEQHYVIGDSFSATAEGNREVVDMQTLAIHELGHLLGLAHIPEEDCEYSAMNPSIFIGEGLANRRLAQCDVEAVQRIYGCLGKACDIAYVLAKIDSSNPEKEAEEEI